MRHDRKRTTGERGRDAADDTGEPAIADIADIADIAQRGRGVPDRDGLTARCVSFGSIIRAVSLTVRPGEFVVLLGPNGAGKSTLMRLLARIVTPDRGAIELFGRPLDRLRGRARARLLAYLPQQSTVDVAYSVHEFVSLGMYARAGGEDRAAVDQALSDVGLEGLAARDVRNLSGGEWQRACLAKILVQSASILLLDEPATGLDAGAQMDILGLCKGLSQSGKGVLAILHDFEQALEYADRVYILSGGSVVAEGDPLRAVTGAALAQAFGVQARAFADPLTGRPRLSLQRVHAAAEGMEAASQTMVDSSRSGQ